MTDPIKVPSAGEQELPSEGVTDGKVDMILSGLLKPNQAMSKALARAVRRKDAEIAELKETLQRIEEWCDAYPLDFAGGMFDKPDMNEVRRLLGDDLLTKLSAYNFRHVLSGIKQIAARKDAK